jgi:hypothetical protein
VKRAALIALLVAGCGGDHNAPDGGGDGGPGGADLSAVADLHGPVDASCVLQLFGGFGGASTTERLVDCTCGCIIDRFESGIIAGFWGVPTTAGASFTPTDAGLQLSLAPPDGGLAIGAVNSSSPVAPFYLDGNFDLQVDYRLSGPLPPDAHVVLTVADMTATGHYAVERERTAGGQDVYSASLGGIAPVTLATTAAAGTLELSRSGSTVKATADGAQVSQFTGANGARLGLVISGALNDCGGGPCAMTVTFHNARMNGGALVDRP